MSQIGIVKTKKYPYGQSSFETIKHEYVDQETEIREPESPIADDIEVPDEVRNQLLKQSEEE